MSVGEMVSGFDMKQWLMAAGALVALLVFVRQSLLSLRKPPLDPQRLFDGAQKTIGRRRSGNRCEHKHPFWFRCKGGADQADHIYPWSKGGATSVSNLQYLCQPHNGRKSAWVPTKAYIFRLQRRRRRYFPAGEDMKVCWKQGAGATPIPPRRPGRKSSTIGAVSSGFYVGFDNDNRSNEEAHQ